MSNKKNCLTYILFSIFFINLLKYLRLIGQFFKMFFGFFLEIFKAHSSSSCLHSFDHGNAQNSTDRRLDNFSKCFQILSAWRFSRWFGSKIIVKRTFQSAKGRINWIIALKFSVGFAAIWLKLSFCTSSALLFWPIFSKESEFAAFSKSERWKRFVPLRKCWGGASDTVLQKTVIIFRFSYQIYLVNFFLLHFKQKIVKLS